MTKTIAKNTKKAATKKSKATKVSTSKNTTKKPTVKRTTVKKTTAKKPAARKPAAKKAVAKKTVTKKAPARKPAARKAVAKKVVRKAAPKKTVRKLSKRAIALNELQQIKGIGEKFASVLYNNRIKSTQDIAKMLKADIDRLSAKLKIGGRIRRENWVAQAKKLVRANKKSK